MSVHLYLNLPPIWSPLSVTKWKYPLCVPGLLGAVNFNVTVVECPGGSGGT